GQEKVKLARINAAVPPPLRENRSGRTPAGLPGLAGQHGLHRGDRLADESMQKRGEGVAGEGGGG
ncbi:MAG TPA: hypothetical protein VGC80_17820, partial [Acetobacteraceae bacterium]